MKALRSSLVNQLLTDPVARDQLRHFAGSTIGANEPDMTPSVRLQRDGKVVFYQPVIVAKAA